MQVQVVGGRWWCRSVVAMVVVDATVVVAGGAGGGGVLRTEHGHNGCHVVFVYPWLSRRVHAMQ